MKLPILCLLFAFSFTAIASNSAGGRGGGTGIVCGSGAPILLEEYELTRDGRKIILPNKRSKVQKLIKAKLKNFPELFALWEKIWNENGDFDSWEMRWYIANEERVHRNISKFFEVDSFNVDFQLENDDFFVAPANCKLIQLSIFYEGKPKQFFQRKELTDLTKRMLELHESIFMLGTYTYGHIFPYKTRDLVKAFNMDQSTIEEAVINFKLDNSQSVFANRLSGWYRLSSVVKENMLTCPLVVTLLAEPYVDMQLLEIFVDAETPISQERLRISKIEERNFSSLNFDTLFRGKEPEEESISYDEISGHLYWPHSKGRCQYELADKQQSSEDKLLATKDLNQAFRALKDNY